MAAFAGSIEEGELANPPPGALFLPSESRNRFNDKGLNRSFRAVPPLFRLERSGDFEEEGVVIVCALEPVRPA